MEEALIKRILPHSIEAEQSVIGSMILDRDAILVASEILTSDDFYQSQYGIIFDAMVELCNEGQPVDLITLQNRLKEKELPPDISSMEYVRRSDFCSSHFCQRKVLCQYCQRKGCPSKTDQSE